MNGDVKSAAGARIFRFAEGLGFPAIQGHVEKLVEAIGMEAESREQVLLALTEIYTNAQKYARDSASLKIGMLSPEAGRGIEIEYHDPDGRSPFSERPEASSQPVSHSWGIGLKVMEQNLDDFALEPAPNFRLRGRKYLSPDSATVMKVDLSVLSFPARYQDQNGDGYLIKHFPPGKVLLAVIDALGHGPDAHAVAETAREYLNANYWHPVDKLLAGCHRRLEGSRGAALVLIQLDLVRKTLSYSGVGNVEVRLYRTREKRCLVPKPGIVGYHQIPIKKVEIPLDPGSIIVIFSDGISARSLEQEIACLEREDLVSALNHIVKSGGRDIDDRTLLAAKLY
ncbi:MAG: SpoIIE family protein phosphatase [bacterium]|nr:SpoIIE family protein phosphatase [bacterium]